MARAETKEEVVVTVTEVVLTLSVDEAQTLRVTGNNIGGSMKGRRGHWASISDALDAAGVEYPEDDGLTEYEDFERSIYFKMEDEL